MKTLAIYAGSFNQFHIGHLNIVNKMKKIFGNKNIMIAVGINPSKPFDPNEGRIQRSLDLSKKIDVPVEFYDIFLHELVEKKEAEGHNVILVRGLRNGSDLEYEKNQMSFINDFKKDINVIFIKCDDEFEHISSSAIRQLESFRPGSAIKYIV